MRRRRAGILTTAWALAIAATIGFATSLGFGPSTFLRNTIIDHLLRNQAYTPPATVYVSLHTADPGLTGANEVTGGSYARQALTLSAGSAGSTSNTNLLQFNSMPATTVRGIGLWDASSGGNFLGGAPTSATQPNAGVRALVTASTDTFSTSPVLHGFAAGDPVELEGGLLGALPAGLTSGTVYYVRTTGLTTTAFTLSTTGAGGSVVDVTADGSVHVRRVTEGAVAAGNRYEVAIGDLDLLFLSG
jgi:hypothetical protein